MMSDIVKKVMNCAKLPEICAIIHPTNQNPVILKRGETGYYPMPDGMTLEQINQLYEVREHQLEAMRVGSLFGFHVPGADADHYLKKPDAVS